MTIAGFWTRTDADQLVAAAGIRPDLRLEQLYRHALAFESWRSALLETHLRDGLGFWYEAQNDYLLCLLHAGRGIWRSSYQALRSLIENATGALYYSEHPVEARRFEKGEFRLTWTETKKYFAAYPHSTGKAFRTSTWTMLDREYASLSKAVHGSASAFRMTAGRAFPSLCSSDRSAFGAWRTRASTNARAVHFLLLQHFRAHIVGARLPSLREEVGRALSASDRSKIRTALDVVLPAPPP